MPIQGVAFDMDGLMFDTEALAIESWIHAGREFGLRLDREIVLLTLGVDREGTKRIFQEHYGCQVDYATLRKKRLHYMIQWIETNGMPIKPGLKELLQFLKDRRIKTAVASSTDRQRVAYYLTKAKISSYFDAVITGDQVQNGKPAPDIYLLACEKMGTVPSETLALEDAPTGLCPPAGRAACR